MDVHHIAAGHWLLTDRRVDPLTKERLAAGDRVVQCRHCKAVFSVESWRTVNGLTAEHGGVKNTLGSLQPIVVRRLGQRFRQRAAGVRESLKRPGRFRIVRRHPPREAAAPQPQRVPQRPPSSPLREVRPRSELHRSPAAGSDLPAGFWLVIGALGGSLVSILLMLLFFGVFG